MASIDNILKPLADADFREVSGEVLYIECRDVLEKMANTEVIRPTSTGLIVYGYIDHEAGLSCSPAVIADLDGDRLQLFDFAQSDTMYVLRINEGENEHQTAIDGRTLHLINITPEHRFCNARVFGNLVDNLKLFKEFIDNQYGMNIPVFNAFRNNHKWDHLRGKYWPDDFQVHLLSEEHETEVVWVRSEYDTGKEYIGTLLNEPYQDFGFHQNDMIGFKELVKDDGEIILYSTLQVWSEVDRWEEETGALENEQKRS